MIEYINLTILIFTLSFLSYIYFKTKKYFSLIKMVDKAIDNLIDIENNVQIEQNDQIQQSDKKQKILECIALGNSKEYLGKIYTEEQINKAKPELIDKLFKLYENKLSQMMVKSLGKSVIKIYSTSVCSLLGLENKEELCDDLESDPFLNKALQRFTCDMYYRFGSYLAPISVGVITGKHYMKNISTSKINGDTTSNIEESEES